MSKKSPSQAGTKSKWRKGLFRALRPGTVPLRELAGQEWCLGECIEPLGLAFSELHLDPNVPEDWKVLAAILAIHAVKNASGRPGWSETDQIVLLQEVHRQRLANRSLRANDEEICRRIARDKNSPKLFRAGDAKGTGLVKQLRKARARFHLLRTAYPLAFKD
jgi:hypothetical protein